MPETLPRTRFLLHGLPEWKTEEPRARNMPSEAARVHTAVVLMISMVRVTRRVREVGIQHYSASLYYKEGFNMPGLILGNDWVVGYVKLVDERSVSSAKIDDEKVWLEEKVWHKESSQTKKFFADLFSFSSL